LTYLPLYGMIDLVFILTGEYSDASNKRNHPLQGGRLSGIR
jgi:hypothetical protein